MLSDRIGRCAPTMLQAIGPLALLAARKTALFCSGHAPGDVILRTYDAARRLRDEGVTVISGFHSPIEKECMRILLRGKQPLILCPARAIHAMRIPIECRVAFEAGRLLCLSAFLEQPERVTRESAIRRNEIVAALADEAFVAYIRPGGDAERITRMLTQWNVPISSAR